MTRTTIAFISSAIVSFILAHLLFGLVFNFSPSGAAKVFAFLIRDVIRPNTETYEIAAMAILSSFGMLYIRKRRHTNSFVAFAILCSSLFIFLVLSYILLLLRFKLWDSNPENPEIYEGLGIFSLEILPRIPIIAASSVLVFRLFQIRNK